jgi:hypothetical protein
MLEHELEQPKQAWQQAAEHSSVCLIEHKAGSAQQTNMNTRWQCTA